MTDGLDKALDIVSALITGEEVRRDGENAGRGGKGSV